MDKEHYSKELYFKIEEYLKDEKPDTKEVKEGALSKILLSIIDDAIAKNFPKLPQGKRRNLRIDTYIKILPKLRKYKLSNKRPYRFFFIFACWESKAIMKGENRKTKVRKTTKNRNMNKFSTEHKKGW